MQGFLSKIEKFLFDILGLTLPGIVFIAVVIFPIYLLYLSRIPQAEIDSSHIFSCLSQTTFPYAPSNLAILSGIWLNQFPEIHI
jgi:hypothetical protein